MLIHTELCRYQVVSDRRMLNGKSTNAGSDSIVLEKKYKTLDWAFLIADLAHLENSCNYYKTFYANRELHTGLSSLNNHSKGAYALFHLDGLIYTCI